MKTWLIVFLFDSPPSLPWCPVTCGVSVYVCACVVNLLKRRVASLCGDGWEMEGEEWRDECYGELVIVCARARVCVCMSICMSVCMRVRLCVSVHICVCAHTLSTFVCIIMCMHCYYIWLLHLDQWLWYVSKPGWQHLLHHSRRSHSITMDSSRGHILYEVHHKERCVELWDGDVWDMVTGTQAVWGVHSGRGMYVILYL